VIALQGIVGRVRPLIERVDALTLRERLIIFSAGVTLVYIAWQTLVMDPLAGRARSAEQRLARVREQTAAIDALGTAASQDPIVRAALRNGALAQRLAALDGELSAVAQGYVAPERMTELLRALLAEQHGLKLVSLANLPVESLSRPLSQSLPQSSSAKAEAPLADDDRGPFLHPVEIVVEGDYASVVAYLRAAESLPWRIQWRKLELTAGEYPVNRVRLVIGALSLSRDWLDV
jgi:MSHA biogenesis protein MshJ